MRVIQIANQKEWDDFVGTEPQSQFAQSWDWADFQLGLGAKIWRLAVLDNGEILATAKFTKKPLFIGKSYFYCDRGPVMKDNIFNMQIFNLLIEEINKIAQSEKAIFFRFDPVYNLSGVNGLSKTIDIQPKKTAILDLSKNEEELLAAMHQKTRYNIRLAQKKGVVIEQAGKEKFEEFWRLMEETRERDEFKLHGKEYYRQMLSLDFIKLYFAKYEGKVIAASIVARYGDMATYMHGGSSNNDREVMAPFLLQWTAIADAKKAGLKYYDFYGVDENKWPGVTRFKMGFNPAVFEYSGTHDLVYNNLWYSVYKWLRIIRRKL